MADGNQRAWDFPRKRMVSALRPGEIVVDLFAGGGGASEALEQALGRPVDIAINHDAFAIGMHAANHPFTEHLQDDVWHADPVRLVAGRPVGWFHASPDCTHFSQARGGQPRNKATRSLSWVVLKWAGKLARAGQAPRIISLENVEQILKWGPLVAKRCKDTGRVMKLDGTVAAPGERVSVWEQSLVPDKRQLGRTWSHFVRALRVLGYVVEWRKLIASDFGAGTSRKRLFLLARRDGTAISWPSPTHGHGPGLLKPVAAGDCIDFTRPTRSIFGRKKPLADATMRRIAKGLHKYVLTAAEPYIVGVGGRMGQSPARPVSEPMQTVCAKADSCVAVPFVAPLTHHGERRLHPADEPLPTVTGANRGELAAVSSTLAPYLTEHANGTNERTFDAAEPLRTQCANVKGGHFAVAAPLLIQASFGEGKPGAAQRWGTGSRAVDKPMGTIAASSATFAVAAAALVQTGYGEREGQAPRALDLAAPLGTIVGDVKHAAVTAFLEQANGGFHDGAGSGGDRPMPTICAQGSHQRLATAHLATLRRNCTGTGGAEPLATITAGAEHHALIECTLSPEHEAGALQVAAFLIAYYGASAGVDLTDPLDTVTTRDRLALVTVQIRGIPHVIVDIGLRMLHPDELFRAQGFPADYIIDRTADGRMLNVSQKVRMCGNSVSPPPLRAAARANLDQIEDLRAAA